jgi:hypothetical protein
MMNASLIGRPITRSKTGEHSSTEDATVVSVGLTPASFTLSTKLWTCKASTNHRLTDIPIVTAGTVVKTQRGEVILIMNQYAHMGQGKIIHSSAQLEVHGMDVNDKSLKAAGGRQRIITPEGYAIPLNIRSGLPYAMMRPYTNKEWDKLPHVELTGGTC